MSGVTALNAIRTGAANAGNLERENAQRAAAGQPQASAWDVWSHTANELQRRAESSAPPEDMSNALRHGLDPHNYHRTTAGEAVDATVAQAGGLKDEFLNLIGEGDPSKNPEGVLQNIGATFGLLTSVEQMISVGFGMIPFPAFPALRITDMDIGLPHAHAHPPNLPPPPPIPLPSTGPVIPIPILSGATKTLINGLPAARCGDMGLGIWCGGYFPMYEVFLGSANVWIEGCRASRTLVDVTNHCLFTARPKPGDPPVGPFTGITISGSPNVLIGGIPMPSLLGFAMAAAFRGLGKLVRAAQRGTKVGQRIGRWAGAAGEHLMNALGITSQKWRDRFQRALCTLTGHPVDVATGKVITEASDLELVGPLSFQWRRTWVSTSTYRGPLGYGWHHKYDFGLLADSEAVAIRLGDGRGVAFPPLSVGEEARNQQEQLVLRRDARGYVLRTGNLELLRFGPVGRANGEHALLSFADLNGNQIRFSYDRAGQLAQIVDSADRRLGIQSDDAGRIVKITVPHPVRRGETMTIAAYQYNDRGDLVSVHDALGQVTRYAYENHLLVQETNRDGMSFYFEYDGTDESARCVRTWGDGGIYHHRLDYDLRQRLTRVTNSLGQVTTYHWNSDGLVVKKVDPLGHEFLTHYDADRNVILRTNSDGGNYTYEYDTNSNRTKLTDPGGISVAFAYNALGQATTMTTPDGAVWERVFDERGNLIVTRGPQGPETRYSYDPSGRLIEVTRASGETMRFEHDPSGMLAAEIDWAGQRSAFEHDRLGRLVKLVLADGSTYEMLRDAAGYLRVLRRPDASERHYGYDPQGNLSSYRDEAGNEWQFEHTTTGRLTKRVGPDGSVYEWRYNEEEQLDAIRNPLGESFRFDRDPSGRVIREHDFDGRATEYRYSGPGDTGDVIAPDGSVTRRRFNGAGHLVQLEDRAGEVTRFAYDWSGRVTAAENAQAQVDFGYDPIGRLMQEKVVLKQPAALPLPATTIVSNLDILGRRVERRSDYGSVTRYEYDANGWLTKTKIEGAGEVSIGRDVRGRAVSQHLPGGIRLNRHYDRMGHLLLQDADGPITYRREYRVSRTGDVEDVRQYGSSQVGVRCNATGRPVEAYAPGREWTTIPRDLCGNALRSPQGETLAYGPGSRLESLDGERWSYDAHNNLVERRTTSDTWRYEYDGRNRLKTVREGDRLVAEYGYDPFGRRLWKRTDGEVTQFVWDSDRLAAEVSSPGVCEYVFEPLTFTPLCRVRQGTFEAFHTDNVGTPFLLTDQGGRAVWEGHSDLNAGVVGVGPKVGGQPWRYQGQYHDEETGLHYNRHRYYSPRAGRYITPDPLGLDGGLNVFEYVPNPLSWIDPFGLQAQRNYGEDEVSDILDQSNGRLSPTTGQEGHPRRDHVGLTNAELQNRVDAPGPPNRATTYESRAAQNRAATQALNSPEGQARLGDIDAGSPRERIRTTVGPETIREAERGRGYFVRANNAREVTVIVDRLPNGEIHIQTCYGRV